MSVLAEDGAPRPYRKRKGEGHERRDEILEAARQIFIEDGYEAATIRKIAARAGVSPTALYLYFPDKDRILVELCEATFARLLAVMRQIRQEPGEPLEKLRRMMDAYCHFGVSHPDEYRLTFMAKSMGKLPMNHRNCAAEPGTPGASGPGAFALLSAQVAEVMSAGLIPGRDPIRTAELIWAGGHGLVSLLITNPEFARDLADRESLIAELIDLQLYGVLKR